MSVIYSFLTAMRLHVGMIERLASTTIHVSSLFKSSFI